MIATQDIALNCFFRRKIVIGCENLPLKGSVVLAPTHRSRWDALMLTMAAGRRITNRERSDYIMSADVARGGAAGGGDRRMARRRPCRTQCGARHDCAAINRGDASQVPRA